MEFGAVMAALRETGYQGAITAEFFDREDKREKVSSAMARIRNEEKST